MKSTKAEVVKRIEEVFKLRLGGAEFADIREYARAPEQAWGVSDGQLWRYVAAADKLVKERFDAHAEHLLARHLLQRRQLFAHCMGAGDFNAALRVLDSEAKLEGLFPSEKHEHTGKGGAPIVLNVVEEIVSAPAPPAGIALEVLTRDGTGNTAATNDPLASRAASLPPQ